MIPYRLRWTILVGVLSVVVVFQTESKPIKELEIADAVSDRVHDRTDRPLEYF